MESGPFFLFFLLRTDHERDRVENDARKNGRDGALAYAVFSQKTDAFAKINVANLLASIVRKGAFVTDNPDAGRLAGYFGFFRFIKDISKALAEILGAMSATAVSA